MSESLTDVDVDNHSSRPSIRTDPSIDFDQFSRLPFDLVCVQFRYFDRRELLILKQVCKRFFAVVSSQFAVKPFLQLDLSLSSRYYSDSDELEAFIFSANDSKKKLPTNVLTNLPPFIRFRTVQVLYDEFRQSIGRNNEEQLEVFRYCLRVIKPALCDKTIAIFHGKIKNSFGDNRQQFLSHLRNEFLPNCNQSHGYKFIIEIMNYSEGFGRITATFFIASILEMPEVSRCSNIDFVVVTDSALLVLPVDTISNWLNQNFNTDDRNGLKTKKGVKSLTIFADAHILNDGAMCDHLKQEFRAAKRPIRPFTFEFSASFGYESTEVLINETTSEQLLMQNFGIGKKIEIKRAPMEKNNSTKQDSRES